VNSAERHATEIIGRLAEKDEAVSTSLRVRFFKAGETVYRTGERVTSLCLVVRGRVQLFRTTQDRRRVMIGTLGPGCIFGEESLLGTRTPHTQAVALEPCTVWVIPSQRALEISATNALFGFGLMQAMGQRVVEAENRLEQIAYSTVASRLAALLLELGGDDPENAVRATHRELADMLGTWRETISKTLHDFRRRGLVASSHRQLTLLDKEGLQLEAGGIH
jgi:CRP/FNR family cyclic AMP-dependent transcriptional regulator